jgi:hypothetical protein
MKRFGILVAALVAAVALAACGTTAKSGSGTGSTARGVAPSTSTAPGSTSTSLARTTTTTAAASTTSTTPHSTAPAATRPSGCRSGDPLANVYHAYRLHVVKSCLTVTGTVAYVRVEDDGDIHLDLSLPASESQLLNQVNVSDQDGQLVTEIVPADQPGCTPGRPPRPAGGSYDYGICTGAAIATPPIGALVRVTGPYVLDADHGWMEIHPVWAITVLGVSQPVPSSQTTVPSSPTTVPSPSSTTQAPGAAWCQATASPSGDGYPEDYEVYVHSNQPDEKATASDATDSWSDYTDGSGYADIRLYYTTSGEAITVTVGSASCSTTA